MLKLTDPGCKKNNWRQLTLFGAETDLMKAILYNLPRAGEFHTFICEHGHTHHVSFQIQVENFMPGYA